MIDPPEFDSNSGKSCNTYLTKEIIRVERFRFNNCYDWIKYQLMTINLINATLLILVIAISANTTSTINKISVENDKANKLIDDLQSLNTINSASLIELQSLSTNVNLLNQSMIVINNNIHDLTFIGLLNNTKTILGIDSVTFTPTDPNYVTIPMSCLKSSVSSICSTPNNVQIIQNGSYSFEIMANNLGQGTYTKTAFSINIHVNNAPYNDMSCFPIYTNFSSNLGAYSSFYCAFEKSLLINDVLSIKYYSIGPNIVIQYLKVIISLII
jgi:hypothetical protein